ncbi:tRNA (adenosine(37)-N6)-threonylcarbamoyltransferase complex dimerization subunit type 1 TsaB [Anatilimnocola sp. NA78]|uniref:tRNA (adenosine(37)-N6)-threonylcarbamoyltransferase complex dimerization subunit type 1 TsaB n=1 Tax=Anatilimnocola sp. NA78 TaxID=3415683 RepID=UPI003CE5252D
MTVWTLALETVATAGSVALLSDGEIRSQQQLPLESRSARTLTTAIHDLWEAADKPKISLVTVASGPGSFTGLRVGVTTAKTLAFAWGAKLIGVNTLDAIAAQVPTSDCTLHVVLDAQRKELFLATYRTSSGRWQRQAADTIIAAQSWLDSLASAPADANPIVAGPALNKLHNRVPANVVCSDPSTWHAQAATIGHLAHLANLAGGADELWSLAPHYLRVSYAEEKRTEAH